MVIRIMGWVGLGKLLLFKSWWAPPSEVLPVGAKLHAWRDGHMTDLPLAFESFPVPGAD